jgi:hypothetical protein
MRYLTVIVIVLALSLSSSASEILLNLDNCLIFNNPADNIAPTKIGLKFTLPQELAGKEIIYAELRGRLSIHRPGTDSLFELRFSPLLADWLEGQYNYNGIEAITDSLAAGAYTIRLGDSSAFFVDITGFIRALSLRERSNFGLIGIADLLGDYNIKLPESVGEVLRRTVRVRVVYK